jgi:inorganic pyrophosphatase
MPKFDIVIETTRGSHLKYRQNPETGLFELRKALPLGMVFPYDFGFIPGTKGEDGDPIDAMVISEFASFTGCRMTCRIIGALLAEHSGKGKKVRNDRFFFIPEDSVTFSNIKTIGDLGKEHNQQLRDFFVNYNKVDDKIFTPLKWIDASKASKLIGKEKGN